MTKCETNQNFTNSSYTNAYVSFTRKCKFEVHASLLMILVSLHITPKANSFIIIIIVTVPNWKKIF